METRTIEEQLKLKLCTEKLKNNEPRPKFTGSYKKKRVYVVVECYSVKVVWELCIDNIHSASSLLKRNINKAFTVLNTV